MVRLMVSMVVRVVVSMVVRMVVSMVMRVVVLVLVAHSTVLDRIVRRRLAVPTRRSTSSHLSTGWISPCSTCRIRWGIESTTVRAILLSATALRLRLTHL